MRLNSNCQITILVIGLFLLKKQVCCSFELQLIQQNGRIQSTLEISDKKTQVQIDLQSKQVNICCKPTRSIFQKIYYFLSNPFLHRFQYSCLQPPKLIQTDTLKLPSLGPVQLAYQPVQSMYCESGSLGLNKQSYFFNLLREGQNQFFTIYVKSYQDYKRGDRLFFGGGLPNQQIQSTIVMPSKDPKLWSVQALNVNINSEEFGKSTVILTSKDKGIKIPKQIFHKILKALKQKQCIVQKGQIFCPCQKGKPQNYPNISFNFQKTMIKIQPEQYMKVFSEVCKVLIEPYDSQNVWKINIYLFNNVQFTFNNIQKSIAISEVQNQNSSASEIKLPIQLMLNCSVILLLCVFVALVLVQLIKRFSGLADVRTQSFRQYMIRREL